MIRRAFQSAAANAPLLLVLTTLFWAGNMTVGRWIPGHVPPVTLAFLRWAGATFFILPFALAHVHRDRALIATHWPALLILGITGSGLFNTLQYAALVHTSATSAAIIYASGPTLIMLMSLVINGERIGPRQALGIAVSLIGVVVIVTHGDPGRLAALEFNRGDIIMLVAMAIWAFYTAYLTRRPAIHAMSFAFVTYAVAALLNLPLAAIELAGGAPVNATPWAALAVLYTAVFPSLLAYLFYNRAVEMIGPARAGIYLNLMPMFTAILAVMLLGERPGLHHAGGFALIILGIAIASRGR